MFMRVPGRLRVWRDTRVTDSTSRGLGLGEVVFGFCGGPGVRFLHGAPLTLASPMGWSGAVSVDGEMEAAK